MGVFGVGLGFFLLFLFYVCKVAERCMHCLACTARVLKNMLLGMYLCLWRQKRTKSELFQIGENSLACPTYDSKVGQLTIGVCGVWVSRISTQGNLGARSWAGTRGSEQPLEAALCLSAPVCQGTTAGVQILPCEFLKLLILGHFDSHSDVGFEQRWAVYCC